MVMCEVLTVVWCFLDGGSSRVSLTEISLAPEEFDDYQIGVDVAITFCLKELRVRLTTCFNNIALCNLTRNPGGFVLDNVCMDVAYFVPP